MNPQTARPLVLALLTGALTMTHDSARAAKQIRFSDFYVGETYQAGIGMTPDLQLSETVRRLNGQTVEILGFMDGILPRDGMHFMMLREPSFQCPFHATSFDWAGFAAVFLKNPTEYMDGPVRVTGRLDVGRKTDEMGLVSYVRIYDARLDPVSR
jgi:hypothetical protein